MKVEFKKNDIHAMRIQDVRCSVFVVILLRLVLAIEGAGTAFSFASFRPGDDGSILEVEDAAYNTSENSYDINSRAFLTGRDVPQNRCGRILYKSRVRMVSKKTTASFNTSFTFAFLKTNFSALPQCGSGMVFTFASSIDFTPVEKSRRGKGMCTFNPYDLSPSNRVFAVKFDSSRSEEFLDPSDSNVGIVVNARVVQYNLCGPNVTICKLFCGDKGIFTAWIDYNSATDILEVRLNRNASVLKPLAPLIQASDLRLHEVLDETMFVGFTASTFNAELHRIRSWSFNSSSLPDDPEHNSLQAGAIVGISVAILAAGLLLGTFLVSNRRGKSFHKLEVQLNDAPRAFTYRELRRATKSFSASERLSSGSFGDVFKGRLRGGGYVAVKRIKGSREESEESFLAEATSLRQIRHRNLLQLRGWCYANEGLFLVYDYMINGSLNKWVHGKESSLPWNVRRNIMAGVAAGLAYLHEEWVQCILHRDIKSSNVMLDGSFNAYLGDFGLARLVDHHKMEKTTLLAGTLGYMAPEMQYTGRATKETDVYAFGILVLEVVCERRPLATQVVEPGEYVLLERVWRAHEGGNIVKVADTRLDLAPELGIAEETMAAMARFLHVGLLCCLPNASERPAMGVVSQWLQQEAHDLQLPPLPASKPLLQFPALLHSSDPSSASKSDTFQTWGFSADGSSSAV